MAEAVRIGMSLDEFIHRSEQGGKFEIINGEIIEMSPTLFGHFKIVKKLLLAISAYAEQNDLGEAFPEATFVIPGFHDNNWVAGSRVPDIAYFIKERLEDYQKSTIEADRKPLALIPDLAVEVVSENDSYSKVIDKVELYLADGVRLVWVIDPRRKSIAIHKPHTKQITQLEAADTLSGEDVIPGFEILVSTLF